MTLAEFLHDDVALLLREVAVQRVGIVSVRDKSVCNLLRLRACTTKYYGVDIGAIIRYAFKRQVFVLGCNHIIHVADVFGSLVAVPDDDFDGIVHKTSCNLGYLIGHSGREQQHFAVVRHMVEDVVDAVDKSHIEHLVGLVEYYGMHIIQVYHAAVYQVEQSSRCGYDDLDAAGTQGLDLALNAAAAIYGQYFDGGYVLGVIG